MRRPPGNLVQRARAHSTKRRCVAAQLVCLATRSGQRHAIYGRHTRDATQVSIALASLSARAYARRCRRRRRRRRKEFSPTV